MANRTRPIIIRFAVSAYEKELIENKMAIMKTHNMGAYLRKMAIDGYIIQVDYTEQKKLAAAVNKVGANFNQICKRVNSTGHCYEQDLAEMKELMKQIWQLLKSNQSEELYHDISVTVDGNAYTVETSNSVPTVNELIAGTMPMGDGSEIVIPKSFLEKLGVSAEEALGKSVDFKGAVYNWDSGEPVSMPVGVTAKIVGVVDTTVKYDFDGQVMEYSVDDAFFFSKAALEDMRTQAKIGSGEGNFTIRAKTPADMIAIKDELNAQGIVPLGRFELVEDMVRLNAQTTQQSGSAIVVIGILAIVAVLAVAVMTALTRRREYAIFKVSGYANRHLLLSAATEFLMLSAGSAILFLCVSPLTNLATTAFWNVNILSGKLLGAGALLVFGMGVLACAVTAGIGITTKASASLKTGDR